MFDWKTDKDTQAHLADLARSRRLIIFVGSGISVDSGLPTWEGFLDLFIKFCEDLANQYRRYDLGEILQPDLFADANIEKAKNPTHVATVLKERLGHVPTNIRTNVENDFKNWFWSVFAGKAPNERHNLIVQTDYPYILTSNYDLLLEEAAKKLGAPFLTLSFHQKTRIAEALYLGDPAIIHVHGAYTDVLLDRIVLTSEDYVKIIKKGEPGFSFALQSLFLKYSTLFVGYGASDPHLEDLVEEFSYFFDYSRSENISRNYLVVTRDRAGVILDDYKRRVRTDLIVIDEFSEYTDILRHLRDAAPRNITLY